MRYWAVFLIMLLGCQVACATRLSWEDPPLSIVWGDAYTIDCDGDSTWDSDGNITCDGEIIEVRGGHMGETFVGFSKTLMEPVTAVLAWLLR